MRVRVSHCCCSPGEVENIATGQIFHCFSSIEYDFIHIHWSTCSQVNFALISSYDLQVQNPHNIKYNGTIQGLKYIWRTEGFRGLFKGNGTNCARIVPNSAVKFFSYEQASKYDSLKILIPLVLKNVQICNTWKGNLLVFLMISSFCFDPSKRKKLLCLFHQLIHCGYDFDCWQTRELCKWFRIDCTLGENAFRHFILFFIYIFTGD